MGQQAALFFKYWILTKRQKSAFLCQVVTPLICLGLIKLITHALRNMNPNQSVDTGVIPSGIYWTNIMTPEWENKGLKFELLNHAKINRWTAKTKEVKEMFEDLIVKTPSLMTYRSKNILNEEVLYPRWDFFDGEERSITALNNQLIKDIKFLNGLANFDLQNSEDLPDSSYLVHSVDKDTGVKAHFQINNIFYFRYHRKNGDSLYNNLDYIPDPGYGSPKIHNNMIARATESGIGHMNIISNMHIQSVIKDDFTSIISVISKTYDSSTSRQILESALSIVIINLFPIALCLGFPLMLFVIVMEKDEKIKDLLDINGLVTSNYWVTFFVYNFISLELTVLVFLVVGRIYVDINFFTKSNMFLVFWFLSAWNCSQIGFVLFVGKFIERPSSATLVGYVISIFLILFLCMVSQFLFPTPGILPIVFYIFPQGALVRFFYLGISNCIDTHCLRSMKDIVEGENLSVFLSIHLTAVFYFCLGIVLNEPKLSKKFKLDLIQKAITSIFKKERKIQEFASLQSSNKELGDKLMGSSKPSFFQSGEEKHSTALVYEKRVAELDHQDEKYVLVAKGLTKTYKHSKGVKKALTNFSIAIEKGKIFGLLGPNGAGKTTFLSLVTGTNTPDSGQAWIAGNDTSDRSLHAGNIGFCPQFDILWPLLNVREHLIFLSMFKGKSRTEAEQGVMEVIKQVDLEEDYEKMANQLSGGMKRRCSLAMALTGNPKIVFLDEPSSGLDPVKRRHFWQLVKSVTSDKAVLLTTHLMEEADTLCNDIGIVTTGKLRCIGNSVYLKNTFTDGIKLQIVLEESSISSEEFLKILEDKLDRVRLESEFEGTVVLIIGDKDKDGEKVPLSRVFEIMYRLIEDERNLIKDWSISLGSLEDVFLNVVKTYRENNVFGAEDLQFYKSVHRKVNIVRP